MKHQLRETIPQPFAEAEDRHAVGDQDGKLTVVTSMLRRQQEVIKRGRNHPLLEYVYDACCMCGNKIK
jgi:hypothetical protein